MPDSNRPAKISFDLSFTKSTAPVPIDEDAPLRIVVLGDFGGSAENPRALLVDCDNFEFVSAQFGAKLTLRSGTPGAAELAIGSLDDFHPDRLLKAVPSLARLADLRSRIRSGESAAVAEAREHLHAAPPAGGQPAESTDDTLARLLGKPAGAAPAPVAPKSIAEQLVRQALGTSAVPSANPEQSQILAILEIEIASHLRQILHDPAFQSLEATWRGLDFLVREAGENVKLHAVDISRAELDRQLAAHENPAATAIGRLLEELSPTVILGAYAFGAGDSGAMARISRLGAATGTAFIAGAKSELLGCTSFGAQPSPLDWVPPSGPDADAFAELRRSADADRIGLALPRFLIRQPYGRDSDPIDTLPFEELPSAAFQECLLWANAAFLCGRFLLSAFASDGWEMELGGSGGEIGGLPVYSFSADGGREVTPCAEAWLPERATSAILSRGLMPVLSVRGRDSVLLVSLRSISDPARPLAFSLG